MNRIVRENYPASKLPEELRPSADPDARTRVTIEQQPSPPTREALVAMLEAARRLPASADDAVERIRALRDEWDE
jgi:hypothetical protein